MLFKSNKAVPLKELLVRDLDCDVYGSGWSAVRAAWPEMLQRLAASLWEATLQSRRGMMAARSLRQILHK